MPIFDYECNMCEIQKEVLQVHNDNEEPFPCECGGTFCRIAPQSAPSFTLKYNPKTDICDWDGRPTRYWDEYKRRKAAGENVRIPELDGTSRHKD